MRAGTRSDTELVLAARGDDPAAYGQLFDRWFDRSWNVARNIVRNDDLAADVAQDALLKAWERLDQLRDPDAFGGWLLRSTRNLALNRLAREQRTTASGDDVVSGLRDRGLDDPVGAEAQPQPDAVSELRDRQELVWAAAAALGDKDVSLLDLHLRHGLSPAELADELGVAANAAHQQLFRLRGRLGDAIGSYLLWRNGRPLCDGLAEAVSGRKAFDRSVAKAVQRHQASCDRCSEERAALVDPSKLFASVPLLVLPAGLKVQAAAALADAGVPVGASMGDGQAAQDGSGPSDGTGSSSSSGANADAGSGPNADAGSSAGANGDGGAGPTGAGHDGSTGAATGSSPSTGPGGPPSGPVNGSGGVRAMSTTGSRTGSSMAARLGTVPLRRGRMVALAGVGVTLVVALVALGAYALRDRDGSIVAAIESNPVPPPAPGQEANGSAGDGGSTGSFRATVETSSGDEAPAGPAATNPLAGTEPDDDGPVTTATGPTSSIGDPTTTEGRDATTTEADDPSTTEPDRTTGTPSTTTSTTRVTTSVSRPTTSESTATTRVTTTEPDTTRPPPEPVIVRFTSRPGPRNLPCRGADLAPFEVIWLTENTDSVTIRLPDGSTARGKPEGSRSFCAAAGDPVTLTANGPGGSTRQQLSL